MGHYWKDLRHITLFHRRYKANDALSAEGWHSVAEAYGNFTKRVDSTDWHWYVVTYRDGREELTYFKVRRLLVPHGGRLCRGILFPRYWGVTQYEHTTDIRLAF